MNGNKITTADYGDTVQMVIEDVQSPSNFSIFEKDLLIDDQIKTIPGKIINNNLVGLWTITQEDLDKTSDYNNFRFKVGGKTSKEDLKINPETNDSKMNITILSPICGSHYNKSAIINISVIAKDDDDTINGTITIDGTVIDTFSNGEVSINKTLDSPGNLQIIVEADNSRGKKSRAISNIMVLDKNANGYLDGDYVAACILEPKDFSNFEGSLVHFDASTTRGIRVTNGALDELVPDEGDVFSWYWKIMPDRLERNFIDSSDALAYKFDTNLANGKHSAMLRVEIN